MSVSSRPVSFPSVSSRLSALALAFGFAVMLLASGCGSNGSPQPGLGLGLGNNDGSGSGEPILTPAPGTDEPPGDGGTGGPGIGQISPLVQAWLSAMNSLRSAAGVPALTAHPLLIQAAQRHANDMSTHDFLDLIGSNGSDPEARMIAVGYTPDEWYQAVLAGQTSVQEVMQALLGNAVFQAAVADPDFQHFGAARTGQHWTFIMAQPLTNPAPTGEG